jgi:hypothetical protein
MKNGFQSFETHSKIIVGLSVAFTFNVDKEKTEHHSRQEPGNDGNQNPGQE